MDNFDRTSGEQQLPQPILEALQKLIEAGSPPETISFALGIDIDQVQELMAKNPVQMRRQLESFKRKSRKYRCAYSNRLMVSPVMAVDGNYYELSILEAHPSLLTERVMPHPKLKADIVEFSKDSLKALEVCLHQKEPQEGVYEFAAECLSVLSLEADIEIVLKVLGAVEGEGVKDLTGKLRDLVPVEYLLSLMNHTIRQLPYQTLYLATLVMQNTIAVSTFEEAFGCFTEQLSLTYLSTAVVELAEEVSGKLSSSELGLVNSVLMRQSREEGVENNLYALRLKEAYLRLREGDVETAVSLVNSLQGIPHLEEEVLKFYGEAACGRGRISILKHKLNTSLEAVSQESPAVATTIRIVYQLFDAEISSLRTETIPQESFASLTAEVGAMHEAVKSTGSEAASMVQRLKEQSEKRELANKESLMSLKRQMDTLKRDLTEALSLLHSTRDEVAPPASIYSYKNSTDQLYETSLAGGETVCHRIPGFIFKKYCCWTELPGESLFVTGGEEPVSAKVMRIDTKTFAVSKQPRMLTARSGHAAVYHAQYLYVLGGSTDSKCLKRCERFVCAESRWEALPLLPTPCHSISGVVVEESLYVLGGTTANGDELDLIQRLSLERLVWEPLQMSLSQAGSCIACFKLSNTEAYFLLDKTLYSLQTLHPVKTLTEGAASCYGPSYYSRGSLYCTSSIGAAKRVEIGRLSKFS
jgi:hypothetical protein